MNKNQKKAFWLMYIGFCIAGTAVIYQQGAFDYANTISGALILLGFYFLVALVLYIYVKNNSAQVDKWLND